MFEAYLDGAEYLFRINDDTAFITSGWTPAFIDALSRFDPHDVGVVGPRHVGGNENILTYDFVRASHVDIFGFYYPRELPGWWADDWMTSVYQPGRSRKIESMVVHHTMALGQRYNVDASKEILLHALLPAHRSDLADYIRARAEQPSLPPPEKRNVIAVALWGSEPRYTYGALANANRARTYFPGWELRVYVPDAATVRALPSVAVPGKILTKLESLGARVERMSSDALPLSLWPLRVAEDPAVDHFIIRDADARLSARDFRIVSDWLNVSAAWPFHCIRDHPSQVLHPLSAGLIGGRAAAARPILRKLLAAGADPSDANGTRFLNDVIWPGQGDRFMCHDSIACRKYPGARPVSVPRVGGEYVGEHHDAYGRALQVKAGQGAPPTEGGGEAAPAADPMCAL